MKKHLPKGIYFYPKNPIKKYKAAKSHNNKTHHIGFFLTIDDAVHALKEFEKDPDTFINSKPKKLKNAPKGINFCRVRNCYVISQTYNEKRYNLGSFKSIDDAKQALKDFKEDPELFIELLELSRERDLPKNIVLSENGKKYKASKCYNNKIYTLGSFATIGEAQQALEDFNEEPELFIQFLKMERKRDLPKGVSLSVKNKGNTPYIGRGHYNYMYYHLGMFATPKEAHEAYLEFKKDPEKWIKENKI